VWQSWSNGYLGGASKTISGTNTIDECKKACDDEILFICKSFNFVVSTGNCLLNMKDRYGNTIVENNNFVYYERNCRREFLPL
jgi:hypothetical protein